jgi:transposase
MRFVPTKTPEQQSGLMLHRTRHLFIRQQTSVINAIRAHLAEFGVTAPVGRKGIDELLRVIADPSDKRVPDVVRACLAALGSQLLSLKKQILDFDRMIMAWHRSNQTSKRLNCIPGVGPLLATALVASVPDPKAFRSGRNFSAWIGLVPKQHSSGGRARLGSISKQGDRYLRSLFVAGAFAVIRYAKLHGTKYRPWVAALLVRRPTKVAAIALANKLARMAWAMMATGERSPNRAVACPHVRVLGRLQPRNGDVWRLHTSRSDLSDPFNRESRCRRAVADVPRGVRFDRYSVGISEGSSRPACGVSRPTP